jgi:hypothetical protein
MNTIKSKQDLEKMFSSLGSEKINLYREILQNHRQHHSDIWNGVRFFMSLNGILIAGYSAILRFADYTSPSIILLFMIPVIGIYVTEQARHILDGHERYYIDSLIRKSLFEYYLGLYDHSFYEKWHDKGTETERLENYDLIQSWHVPKQYIEKLVSDPSNWRKEHEKRLGLIKTRLFNLYRYTSYLHFGLLVLAIISVLIKLCC